MSTTKKTHGNKKTTGSSSKTVDKRGKSAQKTKPVSNNDGLTPTADFLFEGLSPTAKEKAWFEKVKELHKKKDNVPETDKFTDNLAQLYDDLLKELCKCCKVQFQPLFITDNDTAVDKPKKESDIQRSDHNEAECRNKLASSSAKISDLEQDKKELAHQLEKSKEEISKLEIQIAELRTNCTSYSENISKLEKEKTELEKRINVKNSTTATNQDEVTKLKEKLHNQEQNLENRNKRIGELESERDKLAKDKSDLSKENNEFKKRLKDEENRNLKLQKDVDTNKTNTGKEHSSQEALENKNHQLLEKIKELEDQINKNHNKNVDQEKINKKNVEQIDSLTKEVKRLKTQNTKIKDENNVLQAEKESLQTVMGSIKQQVGQEIDQHTKKVEQLSNSLKQLESEIIDLKRSKSDLEKTCSLLHKKVDEQKAVIKRLEDEKIKLKRERKTPDQKMKEIEEENERLRDRLSQVAGNKLTESNPAIADLGDPNRPTQLGERFSELYDNEWTDAMEALGNAGDEKSNITTLRTIVEKSYEFGKTRAAEFVKGMEQALLNMSNSIQVDSTISKFIKDHRKNISLLVTDALYHSFRGNHTEYNVGGDAVKAFMKKTVALCWLMAIQDPPVVLSTKTSGKLDTNFFRHYTKSGATVDFVVWPVVYLHEGGPVICKGVAQGK